MKDHTIYKNTAIDGPKSKDGRAIGNSTRQVNAAIDWMFTGYIVKVRDHSGFREGDMELFDKILSRLNIEHNLSHMKNNNLIKIDRNKLTIELISKTQ